MAAMTETVARPVGITAYGGYVPLLRMQRTAIADAHRWFDPSLGSTAAGELSLCNWDEDPITMAVEAGFDCLSMAGAAAPQHLTLASTSLPFTDRLNAAVVVEALDLPAATRAEDCGSSQRAGTSALLSALERVGGRTDASALVIASDQPPARPASAEESRKGDAAAALMVGTRDVVAALLGAESQTTDFIDHYRGRRSEFNYQWEERWIRDEGYSKLVPPVVNALWARTGVQPKAIDAFIVNCPFAAFVPRLAAQLGLRRESLRTELFERIGHCGVADSLVGLAHWLEFAQPGQTALVVSFGQGVDAMLLRATDVLPRRRPRRGIGGYLSRRRAEHSYNKLLTFTGQLAFERGIRSEYDRKTALTVAYRNRDFLTKFSGSVCTACGSAQIPRPQYCIECGSRDSLEQLSFAGRTGHLLSWSADYLAFSYSPPAHYGMVAFDAGGRLNLDITDVVAGEVMTGLAVRPVFRVKNIDDRRDFRSYFWKVVPVEYAPQESAGAANAPTAAQVR